MHRQMPTEAKILRMAGHSENIGFSAYALGVVWHRTHSGYNGDMGIGTSLFLIAVGAILYFAVDANVSGLEISTIGIILMVVGVIGLLISLFMLSSARRGAATERTVYRDREPY
jgi:membrane-bound ClpP family serine protease